MADCGFLVVCNNDLFLFLLSLQKLVIIIVIVVVLRPFSVDYRDSFRWAEVRAAVLTCK